MNEPKAPERPREAPAQPTPRFASSGAPLPLERLESGGPQPPPRVDAGTAERPKPPQRWRENIEALTMAIVVALLFKYFVWRSARSRAARCSPR
jgi:hypothetical protein